KFNSDAAFELPSKINFDKPGDATLAVTNPGGSLKFFGTTMHVDAGITHLKADNVYFANQCAVHVATGAILSLEGAIEYYNHNGFQSFEDGGTIRQNGDATVDGGVTIAVDHYDWDGNGVPATSTTINDNSSFTINAVDLG